MDGQMITQTVLLVRAAMDAVRSAVSLIRQKPERDEIPVYRLVTGDELLLARSDRATDITGMRWPTLG